jgi:MFS transporter, PPP family, 3-phenylpropionic acid transporter
MRRTASFLFYFFYFGGIAALMPYFVLYYQSLGFNGAEIGLLAGISPLITLVAAPLWTGAADATRRHRLFLSVSLIGVIGVALVFPLARVFGLVLALSLVYSFFLAATGSFADHATMSSLGDRKELYGRLRLGGTIGYGLVASFAGILIQNMGLRIAFYAFAGFVFLSLLVSQVFVYHNAETSVPMRTGLKTLFADRRWLPFLAIAFFAGMGLAALNNYLFPYMAEMGAGNSLMGLALTLATVSELPVMFFANRLIRRIGAGRALLLGLAAMGIRQLLLALFNFPAGVLVFQLFNGFTFPVVWVAGVSFADTNAPPGMRATAQGVFGAMVFGFGPAVGGFLGGPLLEAIGGRALFLTFGLILLISVTFIALLGRRTAPPPSGVGRIAAAE